MHRSSLLLPAVFLSLFGLLAASCTIASHGQDDIDTGPPPLCPQGIESELALVLDGETVPGDLDLGLAIAPETERNPCGSAQEQLCFHLANEERAAVGLDPFIWDGDLADLGRSHSFDRAQQYYGTNSMHGSSTRDVHLYQERAEFLGLKDEKFSSVVENSGWGHPNAESVVAGWMGSDGHRAVILGEGYWHSYTHMACGFDGVSQWNMEFGERFE